MIVFISAFSVSGQGADGFPRRWFWQGSVLSLDDSGRLEYVLNSQAALTSFGYDDAGNLSQRTAADLTVTEYGYDDLNRLVAITNESVEVVTFDHDANGNLVGQTSLSAQSSFGYDGMNRLVASTQAVASAISIVGYQYDLNGNRTHVTYPGGTNAVYVYGADNRLESVDLSAFGIASDISFNYDSASRLTNIVYPNGIGSEFGYDDNGNITSVKHGTFVDRTIQRNVLGFKQTELIDAGLKPTAPDNKRLIKVHNDADQLVSEQVQTDVTNWTTVVYSYNGNGCLTSSVSSAGSMDYSYDYDNRIVSAGGSTSPLTEYLHDASGARIGRIHNSVTNYFVVDYADGLKRPLAEADASGSLTRYYVWSGSRLLCHIEASGDVFYYHADEIGSTLALTDSSGTVTDEFAYMPYGYARHEVYQGSSDTPFQWLGGYGVYYDSDTDLHLTLHRAYSSQLKRFISPDPLGIDGGVNVYAMANLNPLFFVDPYGLEANSALNPPSEYDYSGGSYNNLYSGSIAFDDPNYIAPDYFQTTISAASPWSQRADPVIREMSANEYFRAQDLSLSLGATHVNPRMAGMNAAMFTAALAPYAAPYVSGGYAAAEAVVLDASIKTSVYGSAALGTAWKAGENLYSQGAFEFYKAAGNPTVNFFIRDISSGTPGVVDTSVEALKWTRSQMQR